jgi:hypothetical protein
VLATSKLKYKYLLAFACEVRYSEYISTGGNKMIYLMNTQTGSVDTAENWKSEGFTVENSDLRQVEKDENGDWGESE